AVPAPDPPWASDKGVVKPDKEVMSEFGPLAAAPRLVRAAETVSAPVPPRTTGIRPLERLAALKPLKPEPSPTNVPTKPLSAFVRTFTPLSVLEPVSEAPPRLARASVAVPAPEPP